MRTNSNLHKYLKDKVDKEFKIFLNGDYQKTLDSVKNCVVDLNSKQFLWEALNFELKKGSFYTTLNETKK